MKKILVCDDDTGISEVIKIILEEAKYEVKIINDARFIQTNIASYHPNLILLDIWMPGLDGKEILRIIKNNPSISSIPVIVISALNNIKDISIQYGADDYLPKPFDMNKLISMVKQYTP